jgi:hypothetical protein
MVGAALAVGLACFHRYLLRRCSFSGSGRGRQLQQVFYVFGPVLRRRCGTHRGGQPNPFSRHVLLRRASSALGFGELVARAEEYPQRQARRLRRPKRRRLQRQRQILQQIHLQRIQRVLCQLLIALSSKRLAMLLGILDVPKIQRQERRARMLALRRTVRTSMRSG